MFAALLVIAAGNVLAATPQEVSFQTDDGVTIAGSLYLPGRPGPGIVLVHALSRTREDWSAVAARLADAGFVVLTIDLRGHGASAPVPEGTSLQDLTKMMADVKAARAFLGARREAVPGRVGFAGASIGANLAILMGGDRPDRSVAGAPVAGNRLPRAAARGGHEEVRRAARTDRGQPGRQLRDQLRPPARRRRSRHRHSGPADSERRRTRYGHDDEAARFWPGRWWTGSAARCYDRSVVGVNQT